MTHLTDCQRAHEQLEQRVKELRRAGRCPSCYDLVTGELFTSQPRIYEDDLFQVKLDLYPRRPSHTIVLYNQHRADFAELAPDEAALVFQLCVRVANAIKVGLGAEKVYLNTMCDGELNHLHLQLFPRYPGERIGSTRFVLPRGPLVDGETIPCGSVPP